MTPPLWGESCFPIVPIVLGENTIAQLVGPVINLDDNQTFFINPFFWFLTKVNGDHKVLVKNIPHILF